MLLLTGGTVATAQQPPNPTPNRVFANCNLNANKPPNAINTVAGLQRDILAANPTPGNAIKIVNPVIAYVVIYAIDNENNGQALDQQGTPRGFTGPVICRNPDPAVTAQIRTALQTGDIPNIDILDVQDALILRHSGDAQPGDANRICHTTDGFTDCFDIK